MRIAILVTTLALLASLPSQAQTPSIAVFANPNGDMCGVADSGPGVISLYVVVHSYQRILGTQFSAPIPSCFAGATWVSDTPVFGTTWGNSQTGVAIGFEMCREGWIHVLTINVQAQGLTQGCCRYPFLPHPESTLGGVEFVDCYGDFILGAEYPSFVTHTPGFGPPLIEDRYPLDGATGQPLNTTLSWSSYHCSCALGEYYTNVYFGTQPDPPLVAEYHGDGFDPGPLQGETTYYWKLFGYDTDAHAGTTTPIWSFTTTKGVPVEPTTWGRIKGLYER
jgi:hypothetical protein